MALRSPVRKWAMAVAAVMLLAQVGLGAQQTPSTQITADTIVYVTRTGRKYHTDSCRTVRVGIPMKLADAARVYGACAVCNPPSLASSIRPLVTRDTPASRLPAAVSRQCAAITKKGARCRRTAKPGAAYCWQHGG